MPTITLDLWNDNGSNAISAIDVVCTEAEARQLERLLMTHRFRVRRLPCGSGRHITFQQFKRFFMSEQVPAVVHTGD